MYHAIDRGDVEAMRRLLEQYPDLEQNCPHHHYPTWLHYSAERGQIPAVAFWLERGWDVNIGDAMRSAADGEMTPRQVASGAAMTRYLLAQGARVNAHHRFRGSALHSAVSAAQEPSQKGRRREGGADLEQIRVLIEAGADPSLTVTDGRKSYTPLGWAMYIRRKSAEAYLRSIGAPETGAPPKTRAAKPLDLRKEHDAVYKYVVKSARSFKPSRGNVLGEPGPVKIIHVGFEYSQAAWVIVVFDLRPDAEVDGEWTSLIDEGMWERPRWLEAGEALLDGPIDVVQMDGTKAVLPPGTELAEILGEVVKAAVLQARTDGAFLELPKAAGCALNIEHFSGGYAWPTDEEGGGESLV
jgi:hypothetical protein